MPEPALIYAIAAACFALPAPAAVISINPLNAFPVNSPTWSLFFEFAVNVAFACLLSWLKPLVLITLAVTSFLALAVMGFSHDGISKLGHSYADFFGGIPRTTFSFLMGVLLHSLRMKGRLPKIELPPMVLASLLVLTFLPPIAIRGNVLYDLACVAIVFPAIIIAGAQVEPVGFDRRIAVVSGELSYPIYVLHYPLMLWYEATIGRDSLLHLCGVTLLVIVLSWVILKTYDIPIRNRLSKASAHADFRFDRIT
jgi:peptidoglycan/LPS O-acetylase OafA/YrhL